MSSVSFVQHNRAELRRKRKACPPCVPLNPDGSESWTIDRTLRNTTEMSTTFGAGDVIAVVVEGRGSKDGCIGMATHSIRFPEVDLCEFVETKEYSRVMTMIQIANVTEIILPPIVEERGKTKLLRDAIETAFPDMMINAVHSRFFNAERGVQIAKSLMNKEVSNIGDNCFEKRLAMGAFATLIRYVQDSRVLQFRISSLRINEINVDKTCMIDPSSWESLEVLESKNVLQISVKSVKEKRTLLTILDNTLTENGRRHLRSNVLQPSADPELIKQRLDAVQELIEYPELIDKLRELLSKSHSLHHIMAMCVQATNGLTVRDAESNVSQIIYLYQTMMVVESIRKVMKQANVKSALLLGKIEYLTDDRFEKIIECLSEKVNLNNLNTKKSSMAQRNLKCFAIRENISVKLDVARKAYQELMENAEIIAEELNEHMPGKHARLSYSNNRKFHYTMINRESTRVVIPSVFCEVVRNKTTITFSSLAIVKLNARMECIISEVMLCSNEIVSELIEEIRELIPVLYFAMDALATVDFLCSIAIYSAERDTVRPKFGKNLAIKEGRHPLIDYATPELAVSNDTFFTKDRRFGIITGPNMAGKSTYLKQVAQLCIIAQVGCFVPAATAYFPIFTRIFCRIGHNDSLERKKSSFAMEMADAVVIIKNANSDSLVILDELARSTSMEEGLAVSCAIVEKVLSFNCYGLLATHFLDLAELENKYMAVENYHFRMFTEDEDGDAAVTLNHKLLKGPYRGPLYGFDIVELSTFPDEVLDHAVQLAEKIRNTNSDLSKNYEMMKYRALYYRFHRMKDAIETFKNNTVKELQNNAKLNAHLEIQWKELRAELEKIEEDMIAENDGVEDHEDVQEEGEEQEENGSHNVTVPSGGQEDAESDEDIFTGSRYNSFREFDRET